MEPIKYASAPPSTAVCKDKAHHSFIMPGTKNAFALLGNSDSEEEEEVVAQKEPEVEQIYEAAPAVEFEAEPKKKGKKKGKAESAPPAAPVAVPEAPAAAPVKPAKAAEPKKEAEKAEKKEKKGKPQVASKNKFSALMGSDDEEEDED